jgi:hypothetical protein
MAEFVTLLTQALDLRQDGATRNVIASGQHERRLAVVPALDKVGNALGSPMTLVARSTLRGRILGSSVCGF